MASSIPTLMVIEDDVVDIEALQRLVKKRGLPFPVIPVEDARTALEMLRDERFVEQIQEKLIVLLDINMPGLNGHQFLDELRRDERLKRTVVFILTTSDHRLDIKRAYESNVAGYFVKSNIDGLLDTIESYAQFAEFPSLAMQESSPRHRG